MMNIVVLGKYCALVLLVGISLNRACVQGLRLVRVDLPSGVILGDSARLNCSFDLENDQLYSVKWYKGNREFFRYIPSDTPPSQTYYLPGVHVDKKQSNMNVLVLAKTDISSEDRYKCEVSADAPSFQTIRAEKDLKIYVLPKKGPEIVGVRPQYDVGDVVNVTCHAGPSRPAGVVEWLINGDHPSEEDDAAQVTYPVAREHGLMKSKLGLTFRVARRHFDHNGVMKLKCMVTVSETFSQSSEKIVIGTDTKSYREEVPDDGPVIYGGQTHYHVGDTMNVTCIYARQGKPVLMTWLLNDEEVHHKYLVHYQPEKDELGRYRTALGLRFTVRSAHFRHDQLQLKCIVEVEGPERPHAVHHSAIPGVIHPIDFQGHRPHGSQNGHGQRNVNNGHHQITPPLSVFDHNNLSQQYSANCATTMAWNLPFPYNSFVAVCVAMQAVLHLLLGSYV
ncbi:uncharacterized protein LOC111261018 isoform X1 [Varroa jacobsoni]|uniref:uncharacterized protein LOC111261018 isoform X1 n=1 Tax=Varroa jacobsoni TaxID=62625 RepID=UPI000BF7E626|nr:uncharacterized protein LOC111261018 isoform X1 [Varroa jacobsoni]